MKNLYLILFAAFLLVSCNQQASGDQKSNKQNNEQNLAAVKTIQLNVSGMTCEGCENSIETALTKVDGVVTAEASHIKATTSISYDTTKVKPEVLAETINGLGYTVEK